jgi:hypothetical protein
MKRLLKDKELVGSAHPTLNFELGTRNLELFKANLAGFLGLW